MDECILPEPPKIFGGELTIPHYYHSNHPYTKWMLNMLRGGATYRINTMLKERPEIFQQIYQIPDIPEVVIGRGSSATTHRSGTISGVCGGGGNGQPHDTMPMFNRHTVLYMNPLCLAIYMKKEKSTILILKSGLINSNQKCWATEIYSRTQSGSGDVMEIYPVFIAIRREFFEVIPILMSQPNLSSDILHGINHKKVASMDSFSISDRLDVRYESRDLKKTFRYRDSLQYAIETLKKRGNLPLSRLLELFITECSDLSSIKTDPDKDGNLNSLFNRIIKFAYAEDIECRITTQLIQCLHVLLKYKFVPWTSAILKNRIITENGDSNEEIVKDFINSLTLLLGLYNKIQSRIKNGPLDNLGYLIIKTLQNVQLKDQFCKMTSENLLNEFGYWNNSYIVTLNTITMIQRHIKAILELEKEREFKNPHINIKSMNNSGFVYKTKFHQRSLSSKDKTHDNKQINLLQCRDKTKSNILKFKPNCSVAKVDKIVETAKPNEFKQLYSYQTGTNDNNHNSKPTQLSKNTNNITHYAKDDIKLEIPLKKENAPTIPDDISNSSSVLSTNSLEIAQNNDHESTTQKFIKNSKYGINFNLNSSNNNYLMNDTSNMPLHNNSNKLKIIPELIDNDEIDSINTNIDIVNFEDQVLNELFREYDSFNINYENDLVNSSSTNRYCKNSLICNRTRKFTNSSNYVYNRM